MNRLAQISVIAFIFARAAGERLDRRPGTWFGGALVESAVTV